MSKMTLGIKHVSDIVNEIAKAYEEQSQSIEQVHQAIAEMDDVTPQNAALVEEAAAAHSRGKRCAQASVSLNRADRVIQT